MNNKIRIGIQLRRLNQLKPFKHEFLAEEDYESQEEFWAVVRELIDELEESQRGKKQRATDIYTSLSDSED